MKINPDAIRDKTTSHMGRSVELKGFWYANKLLHLLKSEEIKQSLEEGWKLKATRKVQEFIVKPGEITARVNASLISLKVPVIPESAWQSLAEASCKKAIILAELLSGRLSPALEELFEKLECPLIPNSDEGVSLTAEAENPEERNLICAAFYWALGDKIGDNPFLIFRFRGKSPEELTHLIRAGREQLRIANKGAQSSSSLAVESLGANPFALASSLEELSYRIKADELPASLLRRLNPIPGVQDERPLEEAYEIVARRAQAYALSIPES